MEHLKAGQEGILDHFQVSPVHQRLLSMGISPGTRVVLVRRLPMDGNLYVKFGERNIALRPEEAQLIRLK